MDWNVYLFITFSDFFRCCCLFEGHPLATDGSQQVSSYGWVWFILCIKRTSHKRVVICLSGIHSCASDVKLEAFFAVTYSWSYSSVLKLGECSVLLHYMFDSTKHDQSTTTKSWSKTSFLPTLTSCVLLVNKSWKCFTCHHHIQTFRRS